MRAVVAERPGPPDVLRAVELPDPEPGAGEVVVDVSVAAITFVDTQLRAGNGPRPTEFPFVPGNGVAGTVSVLGEGVDRGWLGARVVTTTGGSGGYTSRALVRAADLHRIPDGLHELTAAAVLADGRTALALERAAEPAPGEVVAVTAAAGGLGTLLVQLAAAAGAEVVGLAGGRRKVGQALQAGAHQAVDYRSDGWVAELDRIAPRLDVVFDGVGGEVTAVLADRIAGGGRYVRHGSASGDWGAVDAGAISGRGAQLIGLQDVVSDPAQLDALVDEALDLAAGGTLRPHVGQTFPLEEAARAHAAIEARETIGKTLLLVGRQSNNQG